MKKNQTKLFLFIITFLLIFIIFLILTFKEYSYEKKYIIDNYSILEKYDKNNKVYTFTIEVKNKKIPYIIKEKYSRKRMLINKINIYEDGEEFCVIPKSNILDFYPMCGNKEEIFTYNLSSIKKINYHYKKIPEFNINYKNIKVNYLNDNSILVYNYKGFYLINEKKQKNISILNKDIYTLDLIYQKDKYLIIPNYNQDYYFNKIFILNILDGKIKEIKFDYDISFDSEFLGHYNNNVYLLDKKEKKEYIINLKKLKVELIDFQVLKNEKIVKTTFNEIINKKLNFFKDNIYNYKIIDNKLFLIINDYKIKLSNLEIDKIIKNDNETVYYLSNESLYMYNNTYGEALLLSNFEWNFNNTNVIYLFK